jgi:hypothetical protein
METERRVKRSNGRTATLVGHWNDGKQPLTPFSSFSCFFDNFLVLVFIAGGLNHRQK